MNYPDKVKKIVSDKINPENINIIDNSALHSKHKSFSPDKFHLKLIIKSEKLEIKYDNAIFNQTNSTFEANGNVEIFQVNENFIIKNDKIIYDQKNNIVSSDDTTRIEDKFANIYFVDSFKFEINQNLIKVKNLVTKDKQKHLKSQIKADMEDYLESRQQNGKDEKTEESKIMKIDSQGEV